MSPCPKEFVSVVTPLLERRDVHALVNAVKKRWSHVQIATLLERGPCDARKVAALTLSLVGTPGCIRALSKHLHDPDPIVRQMTEHAMWSIWLRGGATEEANAHLARGTQKLERKDLDGAADEFSRAIRSDDRFAEAYNQRAMVRYLQERCEESLADCMKTVELEPLHFGAWAGAGHCHACLGQIDEAITCYRRAKEIHPGLACVEQIIQSIENGCDCDDE
jgi:tetratricopeptide (TPR) repeat protein